MSGAPIQYERLDQGVAALQLGEYQKVQPTVFPPRVLRETAEGKFWRKFKSPLIANQYGPVTYIDFSVAAPHVFAVTASTRVLLYDPRTRDLRRQFTRFQETAYSGCLRHDARLLCAGGEQGLVQVFDCGSRSLLRQFRGHTKPVHACRFSPDRVHLVSASDDVTVRYWDITQGRQVLRMDGNTDYVRSAACSPASEETWATGGYDHSVRVWDVRSGECVMMMDHGAPVEALLYLPGGSLLASAGGNAVCVWDVLAGGRLLHRGETHQKTVTSLCLARCEAGDGGAGPRLVTGGLDGHVKVHELDSFQVTHSIKYAAPVTAVGIAPDSSTLAVGMADGALSMKKHVTQEPDDPEAGPSQGEAPERPRRQWLTAHNYRYFIRGQSEKAAEDAFVVERQRRAHLRPYDRLLRQFRHRDALDAALATGDPAVVDAVLVALAQRGALDAGLGGRPPESLVPLLRFLCKHIADPRFMATLVEVAGRTLDCSAAEMGRSADVDSLFMQLRDRVAQEVRLQKTLMEIQGTLEPILARSFAAASVTEG